MKKINKIRMGNNRLLDKVIDKNLIGNNLALLRKQELIIPVILVVLSLIVFALIVSGVVINGTTTYSSTDSNITQKSNGTVAFARLNISSTAPYDSLVGYWSFDFDNSTKAFDWSGNNNDGSYNEGNNGI